MRILIDLQGAQGASRFRGLGRFSLWFARALANEAKEFDVHILLNGHFQSSIKDIRDSFYGIIPKESIHIFYPLSDTAFTLQKEYKRQISQTLYSDFVEKQNPDFFIINSLFEGYADACIFDIRKNSSYTVLTVLHDLIPLVFKETYFKDRNYKKFYFEILENLKKSDFFLSISEASKKDAINLLKIKKENIETIYESTFQDFNDIKPANQSNTKKKFSINKPFILSTMAHDPRKNFEGLIQAFLESKSIKTHQLVVIIETDSKQKRYLNGLVKKHPNINDAIIITGYVNDEELAALYSGCVATIFPSHYEGFGLPVLESMKYGKAVICSNSSSIPEIVNNPKALFNSKNIDSIKEKIDRVLLDKNFREQLEKSAIIEAQNFSWKKSAQKTLEFIKEKNVQSNINKNNNNILDEIFQIIKSSCDEIQQNNLLYEIANCLALNTKNNYEKTIFYDISELVQKDAKTGIQRVVRAFLKEFLINISDEYTVHPIYLDTKSGKYRYAKKFICSFLNEPEDFEDEFVDFLPNDIFLGVDLYPEITSKKDYFLWLKNHGVKIVFFVHDILPLELPEYFGDSKQFKEWLLFVKTVSDTIICNSLTTLKSVEKWIKANNIPSSIKGQKITYIQFGSDIENSSPTSGIPDYGLSMLKELKKDINFLMVGTIEPRKGYKQTLRAFENLWLKNIDCNLIIVGKNGWAMDDFIEDINNHPQLNRKLFWLMGISDEFLEEIYDISTCLIAASEGEGYGLPIIEAAMHKLPIIARDIPVFKEVSQNNADFFENKKDPKIISDKIISWIEKYEKGKHKKSDNIKLITWKESTQELLNKVLKEEKPPK